MTLFGLESLSAVQAADQSFTSVPPATALERGFPEIALSRIAEHESWRKEIHRPATSTHKWWAKRLGTVFRGILTAAVTENEAAALRAYSSAARLDGVTVFDPSAGSGTTIVEAAKLGARVVGWDINPVATLVQRQAVQRWDVSELERAYKQIEECCRSEIDRVHRTEHGETVLYYFWVAIAACPLCHERTRLFSTQVFAQNAYPKRFPGAQIVCPVCLDVIPGRYDFDALTCGNGHRVARLGAVDRSSMSCPRGHKSKVLDALGTEAPTFEMYAKLVVGFNGKKRYEPIAETINGKPYYYLREMARVEGKPRMVSERYLGSAQDIAAAMAGRDAAALPERTRHRGFGDVAAVWGMLDRLGVVGVVDEVVGARRSDAGASVGTYLALAACNRVVDPCSKRAFADWWASTAAGRFTKISAAVLDHRRFWDAMHAVTERDLAEIAHRLALRMIEVFEVDVSALALDMTNFATYIDTTNERAPIAQRGKAKQKRTDLRLVGLGLVVTRDGGIPLVSHAYPGNRPDVTQFASMIDQLCTRHAAIAADHGQGGPGEVTVVFDAGQNSLANFAHLAAAGLGFVGSVPPSDCPDLLALPATKRGIVDTDRFGGLSALQTRREVYGAERRVVLTHSPTLHTAQSRGLDQTLAKTTAKLSELSDVLTRGKTRRTRDKVTAEIERIINDPWARRVISWELTGDTPPEHRLTFHLNTQARTDLETEVFGKRVLTTNRENWPIAEVVAGYHSQSEAEFGFRQLKDPHVVSFSPMHHWTDHTIRVHLFTCVLALQIAHLMRRHAHQHGLHLSVRELPDTLAAIQETVLIYPSTGGRPKARRMLTETTPTQDRLAEIFDLTRWAPRT